MLFTLFRRLLLIGINLFLLSLVSFAIFMRDPANQVFARPHIYSGYIDYVSNLLDGDLGITYNGGERLLSVILTVLPPTLELCFIAILLGLLFGIPLGLIGAFKRKQFTGKAISAISSLGMSLPIFWIAPILLYLAAVYHWEISAVGQTNLLYDIRPITGFAVIDVWFMDVPYQTKVMQNVLQHLALPSLVLMISPTMEITKIVQQRAEWVMSQNYVKFANTRGLGIFNILRHYILRNTMPLLIPHLPRLITFILAQCMLIEGTFAWPGIGRWIIDALSLQDYNAIAAGVIVIGLFIMMINLLTELLTLVLDPFGKKGWYAR
ncbi:cationic peptide transport system permease protein [Pasteurella langaaensis DSM 22999]|uniref:Cationic peptide transport system permease protein n=1 Tax=Alitibacter langaaensis DSM 22999 TaxID=1122935 RepID=A0A2U0SK15_9PAST|nr:ABC transporter permease subunit [Pasteurella langaaensis]PVX31696.1 cationic peptide transport system permease protein [Pasteurella langaaensis DSM 22999]